MKVSSRVPSKYKNYLILDYLTERFNYVARAEWEKRIVQQKIEVNDVPASLMTVVQQADTVRCEIPDYTPPEFDSNYTIIYEDDWLLGINKPPNLRVHGQGKWTTANLMYHIHNDHIPPYPETNLANRLDAHTTGIVILARDLDTLRAMQNLFVTQAVEKTYIAIVKGVPSPAKGVIDLPMGPANHTKVRVRQSTTDTNKPKDAVSEYEVVRTWGNDFAQVKLHPITGRTHQLRVHMAAIGHPLVGDVLYQLDDDGFLAHVRGERRANVLLDRQALHSAETKFVHPQTGEMVVMVAEMPADLRALISSLEQNHS